MPVREVLRFPAAVLKLPAAEIAPGEFAEQIARDLVDTMRASPACVGLAAPQIGVGARAFCLDVSGHKKAPHNHGLVVMINPRIARADGSSVTREGCMSLPDFTGNVRRAEVVVVEGTSPSGAHVEIQATGFEARAFQHEIDHLNGLLFLDRVASITHDVFQRKRYAR
ncbi:MAG: peptide deformylase [Actinomycetota bacterium]